MTTLILLAIFCGGCYMAMNAMKKAAGNPELTAGVGKFFWRLMKK